MDISNKPTSGNAPIARHALNRQIYTAEVYPFSAPNGSRIVVCGHDQGLLVVWKGGNISQDKEDEHLQRRNVSQDVEMTDDEEDEDEGRVEAEGRAGQYEASDTTTHQLDLPLGTAVLHLSFPPLQHTSRPRQTPLAPSFLAYDLVVALACGDGSVRLITIPLQPGLANSESKNSQGYVLQGTKRGEQIVTIPQAHQTTPRGIAMAFSPRSMSEAETEEDSNEHSPMDILLASHSSDLSGTLLIHKIPLESGKSRFGTPFVWRCRPLSSPACSIDLFVPSAKESSPKVLVGESDGSVRVFDCITPKHASGNWSLSLFAPKVRVSENHTLALRSAKWVLGGTAVAILTADGGWGIWDISDGKTGRSVSGARPTPFTVSGRVGTVAGGIVAAKTSNEMVETRSQLAPMTPGTRKIRQDNLFLGKADSSTKRGGITVAHHTNSIASGETDESLVLWYADSVVYLPSLRTYWQNKFRGSSTAFTTSAQGHLRDIPSANLAGESRISVTVFQSDDQTILPTSTGLHLLVAGERSLSISSLQSAGRITASNLTTANQSRISDQSLLSRGLLDVNGLDRVLGSLQTNDSRSASALSNPSQRKVLF